MGSAKKIQQAPEGLYMQPVKTIHNVGQEQRASCLECNETSLFQGINQLSNRKMVPDQPAPSGGIHRHTWKGLSNLPASYRKKQEMHKSAGV